MADTPNSEAAKSIGQDRQYADAIDKCEAEEGVYDASQSMGGKPTGSQAPLPNTPNPFNLTGS